MSNIALNKTATASDSFAPFLPSRAVDGSVTPAGRWVSSQIPAWLKVDLGDMYWINQWIVDFMGSAGWPAGYSVSDFKLQGSLDNTNWFDIDTVTNNTANQINRIFTGRLIRFLRVYISKGLTLNNKVSSIVEFQAIEPANAPFLSTLVPGLGSLTPAFASRIFSYSMNVGNSVSTITFTPTALQTNMAIKVNGTSVISGQASQALPLVPGNNPVTIDVTSNDGTMKTTYTVNVNRLASSAYLSGLGIRTNRNVPVTYTPSLTDGTLNYSANVASGVASIIITPFAANSTILVNGIAVPTGTDSGAITMVTGTNTITINVTSSSGGTGNYTITITKG